MAAGGDDALGMGALGMGALGMGALGMGALDVQGVCGDDCAAQVDALQERGEGRDLVALRRDLTLGDEVCEACWVAASR